MHGLQGWKRRTFPRQYTESRGISSGSMRGFRITDTFLSSRFRALRPIGSLCGCEIPDNACRLCSDGSSVTNPSLFLPTYLASDFFIGAPEGSVLSCATLEAVLHRYEEDAALCLSVQADIADDCGCPGVSIPSQLPTGSPDVSVPSQFPTGSPVTQFPTRPNTEGTGRKGKKEKRLTNGGRGRKVKKDKAIRKKGNFV